ncbi:MAG: AmmeMemoRadiSam system radical SAM enzyme [Pirellulaceae bacterium]|nr:AmmeMemoRadiSam system radical SAM enzyme [Pirellulaceae bacterium]
MTRVVTLPPADGLLADGSRVGGWWHETEDGARLVCDLCPRECHLKDGDRGFCFVRENRGGQLVLSTYGRSTGFCIDPIEKKPLNHFYPGTSVLSFGTAGCNLGCKFCQNWDISKSREVDRLSELATPESIAMAARDLGCRSVAYTYNDPVIWAEYAIDCAQACREVGVKSVAVTAGYISPDARGPFFHAMDAANVDLKAFTEDFYYHLTYSHLQPVLDTLKWLKHESNVWFEITNLIIPQENDGPDELRRMCDWIVQNLGSDVPVHFTAFHPDFRLRDRPPTPPATLLAAYEIARQQGVQYAYVGNVHDVAHQSSYCPECGQLLIERDWHRLGQYHLKQDRCAFCNARIAGHFDAQPGDWGQRRQPVRIAQYASPLPVVTPPSRETAMPTQLRSATSSQSAYASEPVEIPPELTASQQRSIHQAACRYLAAAVAGASIALADPDLEGTSQLTVMGAFVTAKRQGRLRGCCGWLGRPMPLIEAVKHSAERTALDDARMPPITRRELPFLEIDVTLLAGFQPVQARGRDRIAAVEVGRHGLQIQRGQQSGLLLPSVAVEHQLDAEEFLRHVCRKAGLPSNAWEDDQTRLVTFLGPAFAGPFDPQAAVEHPAREPRVPDTQLKPLIDHARQNVLRLLAGATPNYYLAGGSDATVSGLILSVSLASRDLRFDLARQVIRPGVPMQATLFQLCESAAQHLRALGLGPRSAADLRLGLTILEQPAMHGTVEQPDLLGFDSLQHLLTVTEGQRSAWVRHVAARPEDLLRDAAEEARVTLPEAAAVTGFVAVSSENELRFGNAARAQAVESARPAAVAGTFYPAGADELREMVDGLLAETPRAPAAWPAAMVPHAGLVYSGRIAAAVFNQLELPETVIVIGPKHTRLGVPFAVTPHASWHLPGWNLRADVELARELAADVPGWELDAAAHQQEHAIEVELPFIARLAPQTRIVGVALGPCDLGRCRDMATGLARVIERQPAPPLLLISSDMNHFATDAENRRLDELALQALETLDPQHLLETVRQHDISMCGVLPAVVVMETLRILGRLGKCQRVAYATSADVSGDASRVVGYAGVLLA